MKRNGYVIEDSVSSNFIKEQNFYNLDEEFVVGEEDKVVYNIIDASSLEDLKKDETIDFGILVFKDSTDNNVFYNYADYGNLEEWIRRNIKFNIYDDEKIKKIRKNLDDEKLFKIVVDANKSTNDSDVEEKIFALLENMLEKNI